VISITEALGIEQTVRLKLGKKEKKELVNYAERHPEFKDYVKKAGEAYMSHVSNSFAKALSSFSKGLDEVDTKEVKRLAEEFFKPAIDDVARMFSYESLLKSAELVYSKSSEMRKKEDEKYLEGIRKDMKEVDAENLLDINTIKETINKTTGTAVINDIFVGKLTEIAKQKGINYALRDSTIYKAVREMFPTESEYRVCSDFALQTSRKSWSQIGHVFNFAEVLKSAGEELDVTEKRAIRVLDKASNSLFTGIGEFMKVWEDASKDVTEERIKIIYHKKGKQQ
jgi:hypothetical protein